MIQAQMQMKQYQQKSNLNLRQRFDSVTQRLSTHAYTTQQQSSVSLPFTTQLQSRAASGLGHYQTNQ